MLLESEQITGTAVYYKLLVSNGFETISYYFLRVCSFSFEVFICLISEYMFQIPFSSFVLSYM